MVKPQRVDGGPAFPGGATEESAPYNGGMSLRDYIAAQALTGIIAIAQRENFFDAEAIAQDAYKVADAMLAERAKAVIL